MPVRSGHVTNISLSKFLYKWVDLSSMNEKEEYSRLTMTFLGLNQFPGVVCS